MGNEVDRHPEQDPAGSNVASPAPAGADPADFAGRLMQRLGTTAELLGRRVLGEPVPLDSFGLDRELTEQVVAPALRPLYRSWFKVDAQRMDLVPASGPALLVANHSGVLPWDALMLAVAVHDEAPGRRLLRLLAADLVFDVPVLGRLARSAGAVNARVSDAEALLDAGELVGVFPEGFRGTGKLYRDRYRLQRFGRGGFVSVALRTGAPIIPCAVVGAEEAHPMLADVPALARALKLPYFPITPTWPLLGPLGLAPLPASWTIRLADPVPTAHLGAAAADDPGQVQELADRVKSEIARMLTDLVPGVDRA